MAERVWIGGTGDESLDDLIEQNVKEAVADLMKSMVVMLVYTDDRLKVQAISDWEFTNENGLGDVHHVTASLDILVAELSIQLSPVHEDAVEQQEEWAGAKEELERLAPLYAETRLGPEQAMAHLDELEAAAIKRETGEA